MQRITYIPAGAQSGITFEAAYPFVLEHVEGVGGAETTMISDTIPGIDGAHVYGIRTETREVKAKIHVRGATRQDMYKLRFDAIRILAPTQTPGTLVYENDFISVKTPAYPANAADFTSRLRNLNSAEIIFRCPSPFWEAVEPAAPEAIAYTGEGFSFPFSFDEDNDYSISFAAIAEQVSIDNAGSAETPVLMTITGPAVNPAVTNQTTGQTIRVNATLSVGDVLVISTTPGQKSVKLTQNGTESDAFALIDLASVFFQLVPGVNVITYDSGSGSDQTRVTIQYTPRYVGV